MADQTVFLQSEESGQCKNYFVQKVLAELFQGSPILKVRDEYQPRQGYLRRCNAPKAESEERNSLHAKSELVLQHKALHNEDLLPAPVTQVDLAGISTSTLLQNRRNRRNPCDSVILT